MFCLLQLYPPEAADYDEPDNFDVLAVDRSLDAMEAFLETYEPRYRAASDEFQAWDKDKDVEWTEAHENKLVELARKYHVHGSIIPDVEFRIVETLT